MYKYTKQGEQNMTDKTTVNVNKEPIAPQVNELTPDNKALDSYIMFIKNNHEQLDFCTGEREVYYGHKRNAIFVVSKQKNGVFNKKNSDEEVVGYYFSISRKEDCYFENIFYINLLNGDAFEFSTLYPRETYERAKNLYELVEKGYQKSLAIEQFKQKLASIGQVVKDANEKQL